MRKSTQKGLARLNGMIPGMTETAAEMAIERGRFDQIREDGPTRTVSAFNLFQTPDSIAWQMAGMIPKGGRILEPSAGLGRIVSAINQKSNPKELIAVESASQCAAELYRLKCRLFVRDFLEINPCDIGGLFDAVVMNPPFKSGRDVKHIKHAFQFLKPKGVLVSLCFNGVKQNRELREWADCWEVLPLDSFKESGTRASVAMLTKSK